MGEKKEKDFKRIEKSLKNIEKELKEFYGYDSVMLPGRSLEILKDEIKKLRKALKAKQ